MVRLAGGLVFWRWDRYSCRMERGQKVVCVDDRFPAWAVKIYTDLPKKGVVYTIREVCLRRETIKGSEAATVALLLHELHNPPDPSHKEHEELAFKSERFAPLHEEEMETRAEIEEYVTVLVGSNMAQWRYLAVVLSKVVCPQLRIGQVNGYE